MDDKLYKHLGYSPGEEWAVLQVLSEGLEGTEIEAIGLLSLICEAYDKATVYALTTPKPVAGGEVTVAEWGHPVRDSALEINQLGTALLLSLVSMSEKHLVNEQMVSTILLEKLKTVGLQDTHYFESNTLRSLFSVAAYYRVHVYGLSNMNTGSMNISDELTLLPDSYLMKAGNELGPNLTSFTLMLGMKATAELMSFKSLLADIKENDESLQTEQVKYRKLVDAMIQTVMVLDLLGYDYQTTIGLAKMIGDEN